MDAKDLAEIIATYLVDRDDVASTDVFEFDDTGHVGVDVKTQGAKSFTVTIT